MATTKKASAFELDTTFGTGTGYFMTFLDMTETDKSKRNKRISMSNYITRLIALIVTGYTQEDIVPSGTESVGVGAITSYRSWRVEYTVERGTLFGEGNIRFYHDGTNIYFSSPDHIGDDIVSNMGTFFTFSISAGQLFLEFNSDALDGNTIKINYKVDAKPIAT